MFTVDTLRSLLEPFGQLRSQSPSEWTGQSDLPAPIADFYQQVGPLGHTYYENVGPVGCTLTVGGNPVCIPPLSKLAALQAGYAWSETPAQPLDDWNPNWLVIAEQGGDPFIYDKTTGHVLFAFHGAGSWKPTFFTKNLTTAIGALATVATSYCCLDEDQFFDEALLDSGLQCITDDLANVVGGLAEAQRMLDAWEYEQ
ncbi:hypothetical protein ACLPHM_03410 [Paenalcaligenes sp. Me131]|uniref:hypothetical protein n=1 Tax=Paenalcaligenes sp. Me131 TaxID=3392636 RepID=UPI003D270837